MSRLIRIIALVACAGAVLAPSASAQFGLQELDVSFEAEGGGALLQAGAHPFSMSTSLGVATVSTPEGNVPEGELRTLSIAQIPGLIGSQTAVDACDQADFIDRVDGRPSCPDASAVGYAAAEAEFKAIAPEDAGPMLHVPVYNLDPPPGVAAQLGFVVLNEPITIDVRVSAEGPYNLLAELTNVPQALLLYRSKVVLWGNPASEAHDTLRGNCLGKGPEGEFTLAPISLGSCPVDEPERAFLTLPRSCGNPLVTAFDAVDWLGVKAGGFATTHNGSEPKGIQGCDELDFEAGISAQASTSASSSPSGLTFGLAVNDPGLVDADERAQSDIRSVVATLPPGMTLNPSAANGLEACSADQYKAEALRRLAGVGCPQASKIGSAEVISPLLSVPLQGDVYVAEQINNPFGSLFAVYLVIRNERYGVMIKQAGKVEPDPLTGQLRTTFEEIPQLPFADLKVSFRSGPRAPLTTPPTCGTHTATATLTPWSGGKAITPTSSFSVTSGPNGGPCPTGAGPFSPALNAGTTNSQAGAYSPFYLRLTRGDGEQPITRFDTALPPGVVGKIAGLGRCPDAAIAAAESRSGRTEQNTPSCPSSSRIGTVEAGAGAGSVLTYVKGALYLAGPYDGKPLSVVAITPAVAGPFDLGTVAIREGLQLNPATAEVEVSGSGPEGSIPTILEGVPLQVRDLRIAIDRPDFTLNATSCKPKSMSATVFGSPSSAALSDYYQASNCRALAYKPRLSLALMGATKRNKFPAVRSVLVPRAGDANTARAVVTLPPSQQIENAHINNPCTRDQFAANACPPASVLGTARAYSPLLDEPLEGPVYFRSNGGARELPDIVADLHGLFHIEVVGFIDAKGARIRTTFATVPDAPVSRFELNLVGGKKGLLVNNRNLCKGKQRAKMVLTAQNGVRQKTNPVLKTSCKKKKTKNKHR